MNKNTPQINKNISARSLKISAALNRPKDVAVPTEKGLRPSTTKMEMIPNIFFIVSYCTAYKGGVYKNPTLFC